VKHEAILGLGGNVGDALATVERAVEMLCDDKEIVLRSKSSAYLTPAWGDKNQPSFINMCIAVLTNLDPRALLMRTGEVEAALGRDRKKETRWGPRTIDIDILSYDDLVLDEPDLVLPHPYMFERAFVLMPLFEIMPDRVIGGRSIRDALGRLDTRGVDRLTGHPGS
jgi:2-amino-4-hydroxy-6-hydroxymethyldihydropteridine diphosphokinase